MPLFWTLPTNDNASASQKLCYIQDLDFFGIKKVGSRAEKCQLDGVLSNLF